MTLCETCVASIASSFNNRFEKASSDMVARLAVDSADEVVVQNVLCGVHKDLVLRP